MQEFKVSQSDSGKRTDVFVAQQFPDFTRSALKGLFEKRLVLVNNQPEQAGDKLKKGDRVSVDASILSTTPEAIDLPIIYEDDDVVVIDKPPGLLTHSKGPLNLEPSVASFLRSKISDKTLSGNRAGIVHRLDRGTSGVIIGAKNSASLKKLQEEFSKRRVKKTYEAVVASAPEPSAIIDLPIIRNPSRPQTFKVGQGGKASQTQYQVVKTFEKGGKEYSRLKLQPLTGRTHQIRVHLAYIGHPVIGDRLYGKEEAPNLMLHASSLEIKLPSGETRQFDSPLPKIFKEFMQ